MEGKPKSDDVLNAIIPPREWIQGGKQRILRLKPLALYEDLNRDNNVLIVMRRQTLDLEGESVACEQDRCGQTPRDA